MKLYDWLSVIDTAGINCNIYIAEDGLNAEPIYCGSMYEIPYWLADLQIAKYNTPEDKDKPIFYAHDIRSTCNDTMGIKGYNGFVITLTEGDKE